MEDLHLRKWVSHSLKLHGYSIRADAANYLTCQFQHISTRDRQKWMEKITDHLQKLNLTTPIVDKEHVEVCWKECTKKTENADEIWRVINIFEIPQFVYCRERKKFLPDETHISKGLFSDATTKISMYRRRYDFIFQRTSRHELFQQQKLNPENPVFVLKTVEWFLCSTDRIENAVIVGLLVQKDERSYVIEDITGSLQLDISKAKFHEGLFPEHCFVLVEGIYDCKVFHVQGIGFPPSEPSIKSRPYFGNVNVFGGPSSYDLSQNSVMRQVQQNNPNVMIVFMSDVWLDKIEVLEKLEVLFAGFEEHPPLAFVLIGNFVCSHKGAQNYEHLKSGLKSLGKIISRHKEILERSNVVLVPGPNDPGSPHILPRPPLPEVIAADLKLLVPKAVLATNPCRIQYCCTEIVIIREDLIKKMCRNTIYFPATGDIETHFAKTIISQGTLVPLSPNVCPVYWNYSHCLDIYPLPDLIVTADQFNPFAVDHMGCKVINPGTFMKNSFSFRVYLPKSKEVQESIIPDNADSKS